LLKSEIPRKREKIEFHSIQFKMEEEWESATPIVIKRQFIPKTIIVNNQKSLHQPKITIQKRTNTQNTKQTKIVQTKTVAQKQKEYDIAKSKIYSTK
jgi:hypothetical protein